MAPYRRTTSTGPLTARNAYRLWAATYDGENPVTALEDRAVRRMTPRLAGRALLDVACGTGQRLPLSDRGTRTAVGIDLVFEMIVRARDRQRNAATEGRRTRRTQAALAVGDVRALPCPDAVFDVVWCRLTLGYVPQLQPAYAELARVARMGAYVIVSDFHPSAARAGYTRSFRDEHGERHIIENYIHESGEHVHAAREAGLMHASQEECAVGPAVRRYYEAAGQLDQYARQKGLPFVLVLGFRA
jgi:malonyl-CoA O-methyltransferase